MQAQLREYLDHVHRYIIQMTVMKFSHVHFFEMIFNTYTLMIEHFQEQMQARMSFQAAMLQQVQMNTETSEGTFNLTKSEQLTIRSIPIRQKQ